MPLHREIAMVHVEKQRLHAVERYLGHANHRPELPHILLAKRIGLHGNRASACDLVGAKNPADPVLHRLGIELVESPSASAEGRGQTFPYRFVEFQSIFIGHRTRLVRATNYRRVLNT